MSATSKQRKAATSSPPLPVMGEGWGEGMSAFVKNNEQVTRGFNNWKKEKLGDLVSFKTGKLDSNAAIPNGDFPFFTCSQETLRTNTFSFDTECVLLAGNNANGIYPLKYFQGKFDAYQRTYVITTQDPDRLRTRYLYYALRPKLTEFRDVSTGAATKFLTLGILKDTQISLPPIGTQDRIVGILSAYDELIENNQRRIKILETMARNLYREWFVHFRFPGHEKIRRVSSPLGETPEGWEVRPLAEVTAYLGRGISPKYDDSGDSVVINQKCIRDQRLNLEPARRQRRPIPQEKQLRLGDVLVNSTGVGTLGRVAQVYEKLSDCTVDSHVSIVRPNERIDMDFFGCALLQHQETFERLGIGATGQTELSRTSIGNVEIAVPQTELQRAFGKYVRPMRAAAMNYGNSNQKLRYARDLLLPRLLSGSLAIDV